MELKARKRYLAQLTAFQDTGLIKVISGIRRCGKSSLLQLLAAQLRSSGVEEGQLIAMNFESLQYGEPNGTDLYHYVMARRLPGKRLYLLLDEVQQVPGWQKAITSFQTDLDCDIYITGSNAFLLSSQLSTYLAGRYVELKMLPLSFAEFLDFQDYSLEPYTSPLGGERRRALNKLGQQVELRELLEAYIRYGGMPALRETGLNQQRVAMLLDGIYSTVVMRDILERGRLQEQRAVTDALLLRKLILFLADNVGSSISARSIGRTLVAEGLLNQGRHRGLPAVQTISAYLTALLEAYVFYEVKRFDIRGRDFLRTLGKYYIVDTGLRNYLLGQRGGDSGHLLENVVFLELLRRGQAVAVGKLGQREIDFVVTAQGSKQYIQVTESLSAPETRERELAPLLAIADNYEKLVITLEPSLDSDYRGIKIVNIADFLLEEGL